MILATTKVKDLEHFLEVYGSAGADKRGSHGSKGSTVYRDPIEEDRVWAVFDWDEAGWTAFATDPETPGIMQEAGHLGRPSLGAVPRSLLGLAPQPPIRKIENVSPPARTTPCGHGGRLRDRAQRLSSIGLETEERRVSSQTRPTPCRSDC